MKKLLTLALGIVSLSSGNVFGWDLTLINKSDYPISTGITYSGVTQDGKPCSKTRRGGSAFNYSKTFNIHDCCLKHLELKTFIRKPPLLSKRNWSFDFDKQCNHMKLEITRKGRELVVEEVK